MTVAVYGVRHHGPGCARSLLAALEADPPDALLVEGPPDADPLLAYIGEAAMVPPVAILVFPQDDARRGVFYPYARFSPEWQAMRWAAGRGIPIRFCDLPIAHRPDPGGEVEEAVRPDPLAELARAAGWPDAERYWEHLVEQRADAGVFEAVALAMAELRAALGAIIPDDPHEARREAWMRRTIRAATKSWDKVAVVCGAWHVPALTASVAVKDDDARLRDLPRVKVEACWVPWSLRRLARGSGYGAGVDAPGWWDHLWSHPDETVITWLVATARALREAGHDASPASVTEAVRLAWAIAGLRGEHAPGLDVLDDVVVAALCQGHASRFQLVRDGLALREELGSLPDGVPQPPLLRDMHAQCRRLRLKLEASASTVDLDLRKDTDRARSAFLHRTALLGLRWAAEAKVGGRGTFREGWTLAWDPTHALALVEASPLGNTVEEAATARVMQTAAAQSSLEALAVLLDRALLAGLDATVPPVLDALEALAVRVADPSPLLGALPPMADVLRYGDVRGAAGPRLAHVFRDLLDRALIALVPGSASLDDDAAGALSGALHGTQAVLVRLEDAALIEAWDAALVDLHGRDRHGLLLGTVTRLRLDRDRLDDTSLRTAVSFALSPAHGPLYGAWWLQGLLSGGGAALLHREAVWTALDAWLVGLPEDAFVEVLPSLRRAFSDIPAPQRAQMAERLARGRSPAPAVRALDGVDVSRADRVLPTLAALLGGAR